MRELVLTISWRFWSIASSLWKQSLRIWLSDLHITWEENRTTTATSSYCCNSERSPWEKKGGSSCFSNLSIFLPPLGFCSANRYSCQGNLKKAKPVTGNLTFNRTRQGDFLLFKLLHFIKFWSSLFSRKQQTLKVNISEITYWSIELGSSPLTL